jgi:hypothetical protein
MCTAPAPPLPTPCAVKKRTRKRCTRKPKPAPTPPPPPPPQMSCPYEDEPIMYPEAYPGDYCDDTGYDSAYADYDYYYT